jgi:hypothetical protein
MFANENNKRSNDMKEEILSIASDLREGSMSTNEARTQLLRLFNVSVSLPEYELAFCEKCYQMTNHLNGICQKCKGNER